jgi:hypothetical protein
MTFLKHKCGRPPCGAVEVLALRRDGHWISDDGKKHRGFSYKLGHIAYAIAEDCNCSMAKCPQRQAMDKTCDRWHCANGTHFA